MTTRTGAVFALAVVLAAVAANGQQLQPPASQQPAAPAPAPDGAPPAAQPPSEPAGQTGATSNTPLARLLGGRSDSQELVGNRLSFIGSVELQPPNSMVKFFADRVDVYFDDNRLEANGNVVFSDASGRIAADRVEFDLAASTGVFYDASGIMAMGKLAKLDQFAGQDPDVYFYGERIEMLPNRKYRITKGGFTTCVQPTPRWELASGTVDITLDDRALARGTVLRVKGTPVFYLPVVYYPLQDDERATGFLLPTYGSSTYRGQAISNGFFWAINRSHDLTLMHDWFTRSGQGAGAEYRYVADAQSSGTVKMYRFTRQTTTYDNDDGPPTVIPAEQGVEVQAAVNHRLTRRLRARARVDYFSDLLNQQLYHQNIYQSTRSTRVIDGSVSGTFGRASASAQYQRSEYLSSNIQSNVYGSTPRLAASIAPAMLFGAPIYASAMSDYAFIPQQTLANGRVLIDRSLGKWDVAPSLRVPLSRLTYLSANTSASYRSTYYSRSLNSAGILTDQPFLRQFFTVGTEVIGPVLTKIWDTPESTLTERMKHVIEPTFAVDYTTEFANQSSVPSTNDAADYVVGGNTRVTYGVTNRLFYRGRPTGDVKGQTREFVTIGVQQSYYSDPLASLYDTSYVSYSGRPKAVALSPIAVTGRFSPTVALDANARVEYDINGNGLQSFSTGGSMSGARGSAYLTFSRTRPTPASIPNSFLSGFTSVRMRDGRVIGSYTLSWDVNRGYIVNQSATMSYMAQCCGVKLEFQKFNYLPSTIGSPLLPADRRFNVSIVLAGLGSVSNFFGAFGGNSTVN